MAVYEGRGADTDTHFGVVFYVLLSEWRKKVKLVSLAGDLRSMSWFCMDGENVC